MKKSRICIVFIVLFTVSCNSVINTKPSRKNELENMLTRQQLAWNKADIKGFMDGYLNDSSMQFISKKGTRFGWQKTLDAYKKHYPTKDSMGKLEFKIDKIEFFDSEENLGHITGSWKLIRYSDTPSGYFSLITRQTKNGPKIIIDHTW